MQRLRCVQWQMTPLLIELLTVDDILFYASRIIKGKKPLSVSHPPMKYWAVFGCYDSMWPITVFEQASRLMSVTMLLILMLRCQNIKLAWTVKIKRKSYSTMRVLPGACSLFSRYRLCIDVSCLHWTDAAPSKICHWKMARKSRSIFQLLLVALHVQRNAQLVVQQRRLVDYSLLLQDRKACWVLHLKNHIIQFKLWVSSEKYSQTTPTQMVSMCLGHRTTAQTTRIKYQIRSRVSPRQLLNRRQDLWIC